jgi:hypothetical protein
MSETKAEERDRLQTRTNTLQGQHDAMRSPPRSDAERREHAEHRKNLRAHKEALKASLARAVDR